MLPSPPRFPLVYALLALMLLGATGFGESKGIIIYKDQTWMKDGFAEAIEYDQVEEFTNIYHLTTSQNEKIPILTWKIVKNIRYLDSKSLTEIIEPRDLARVSASISELSAAARQYPKSSSLLEPHIKQLQEIVDRFQKGEVIMDGHWLPSKEAAIKLKNERAAAIAAADAEDVRQREALRAAKEKMAADARAKILEAKSLIEKEALRKEEEARAAEEQRKLLEDSEAADARRKEEQQRAAQKKQEAETRLIEYASRKMREADRFTEEFDHPVSSDSANTLSVAKLPEGSGEQTMEERAVSAAKAMVQKQLRAPMDAKFQEARVLEEADPWYQLFVAVDAQNAFGVYIRGTYVCTLKLGAGDEFSYDHSLGVQKMDEDAIKRDGVLDEIRAACGWRANQKR